MSRAAKPPNGPRSRGTPSSPALSPGTQEHHGDQKPSSRTRQGDKASGGGDASCCVLQPPQQAPSTTESQAQSLLGPAALPQIVPKSCVGAVPPGA